MTNKQVPQKQEPPAAVLVGVLLAGEDKSRFDEDLNELDSLLSTLGIPAKGRIIQRRQKLTAKCLLGSGKVQEIKELAANVGANTIVFDRPLSPPQVRNLEEMTGCQILDRAGVILDIFAKHARSNQAKTQVEIARLEYLLPRLSGAWTHFQRQTGGRGVHSRGMGEKQIEIDRRRARERISKLQRQLEQFARERATQRKARANELRVAIVGYTNTGKTTIMNALTNAGLLAKNELFATLDTNVKTIDPNTRPKILLSDTVGFIRNLPHGLVESFKSTLDEVAEADLLLHVVDVSHPGYTDQIQVTEAVLAELGAANVPHIMVFNKADLLDDPFLPRILRQAYPGSMTLSAHNRADILRLREHVFRYFANNMIRATLAVPQTNHAVLSLIYQNCLILKADYSREPQVIFEVQAGQATLAKLKPFVMDKAS